jgi:competence protein ComEA
LKLEDGFGVNDQSGRQTEDDGPTKRNNTLFNTLEVFKEKLHESGFHINRQQAIGLIAIITMMIAGILISFVNSQPHPINEFSASETGAKNGVDGGAKGTGASIAASAVSTESDEETSQGISASGSVKQPANASIKNESFVMVHIAGAVTKPGVYKLKDGSRINDAINAAGGGAPMSDINVLNLAEKVQDAQKIYVPKRGETPSNSTQGTFSPAAGNSAIGEAGINSLAVSPVKTITSGSSIGIDNQLDGSKINLNTATIDQLDALPGVGQVTAQRIIDYRTQHGAFKSVSELQEVEGIGPKKFDQLKPHIIVN